MAAADYFDNLGTNMLGGAANTIFGIIGAEHNARINYKYNEMAAENADKRTRALYGDYLSPSARIKQLKEAGLSPSLFADGAGGGAMGMTQGAQGSGASGVGLPTGLMTPQGAAEIEVLKAQARNLNAEADEKEGKNPMGKSKIAEAFANAGAQEAAAELTKAQTCGVEIDNYIKDETKDYSVWQIKSNANEAADNARKAYFSAEREGLNFNKDLATFQSEVEIWALRASELAADIALKKSQTQLNNVEKTAIKDYVVQGYIKAISEAKNAYEYADYVEAFCENLPQQIELRKKELNLEKWKVATQPFIEVVRTAGYIAGASQLGDGGTTIDETTTTYGKNGKPTSTTTKHGSRMKLPKVR